MAIKLCNELIDDLDGSPAHRTHTLVLDGVAYEIDLSETNSERLTQDLAPWCGAARRISASGRARRTRGASSPSDDSRVIREWAHAHGYQVSDRGRIPATLRDAYANATAGK